MRALTMHFYSYDLKYLVVLLDWFECNYGIEIDFGLLNSPSASTEHINYDRNSFACLYLYLYLYWFVILYFVYVLNHKKVSL